MIEGKQYEAKLCELMLTKNPIELVKTNKPFRFGNYDKYYSFRYKDRFQDSRLQILNKDYFLNKDCLDIGCNDGSLTIMLAIKYFPKNILGVDIDFRLVNKAIDNLHFFEKQQSKTKPYVEQSKLEEVKKIYEKMKCFPQSFQINMGVPNNLLNDPNMTTNENFEKDLESNENEDNQIKILNRFPNNISFRIENFIKDLTINETFDTISCFSTSKWIHLNWGDTGIKRLFKKVYDSLNKDGFFILEPQEWRAYKKKKCMNDDFKKIYKLIKLRPKDFGIYLENELGFKLKEKIIPDLNVKHSGFKRPIYIYQK